MSCLAPGAVFHFGALMEQPSPRCAEPFDGGKSLCRSCTGTRDPHGLRRCSRVVAESAAMKDVLAYVAAIAPTDAPVVIQGETGTGKEVLARLLHTNSPRHRDPFVAVNVAALPSELLESELFGHARGAFSGAVQAKEGLFETAHGGTLFLDEISELPSHLQAKLLRALQEGEVRRVGDTRTLAVDVRILCASNRGLADQVSAGAFREDLYYRLKVFSVTLPPLRERVEDIVPLAKTFASLLRPAEIGFSPRAVERLERYRWPGNVRELQNTVRHGVTLAQGQEVDVQHLPPELLRAGCGTSLGAPLCTLSELERAHIGRVLDACGGNQVHAARILGIARNTLWRKMRGYGIGAPASL